MELWRVDEGQVEPRVVILHLEVEPDVPDPRDRDRRARQHESRGGWQQSSQKMFDGVAVDGDSSDGRYPLVMRLVDVLVDGLVMQESVGMIKEDIMAEGSH